MFNMSGVLLGIKTLTQEEWEELLVQNKPIKTSKKHAHDSDSDSDGYQPKAKKRTLKKKVCVI